MGSAVKRLLRHFEEDADAPPGRVRVFLAWLAVGLGGAYAISYGAGLPAWLLPVLALAMGAGGWLVYRRLDAKKRIAFVALLLICFWAVATALQLEALAMLGL